MTISHLTRLFIAACSAQLACTHLAPAESTTSPSVRLTDEVRAQQIRNLGWGMFICWSFSTFSGQEWTPT